MVKVDALYKSYGKQSVLRDVSLEIKPGKISAILGHNGSGKTTLIKSILGLVIPDRGSIFVDGQKINGASAYRRDIGYISQIARFPDNLTVAEVIAMVKDLRSQHQSEAPLIKLFNLEAHLNKSLRTLSGGTKQKVNVVLAMMHDPRLLICDEPTVGLDPISLVKLKDTFRAGRAKGQTIILITHIMSLVEELADDLIYIQDGQIYFVGTVDTLITNSSESNLERAIAKLMEEMQDA